MTAEIQTLLVNEPLILQKYSLNTGNIGNGIFISYIELLLINYIHKT